MSYAFCNVLVSNFSLMFGPSVSYYGKSPPMVCHRILELISPMCITCWRKDIGMFFTSNYYSFINTRNWKISTVDFIWFVSLVTWEVFLGSQDVWNGITPSSECEVTHSDEPISTCKQNWFLSSYFIINLFSHRGKLPTLKNCITINLSSLVTDWMWLSIFLCEVPSFSS